jgi:hypothetical protein
MYSSVNNIAHNLNMYPLLNKLSYFLSSTFVKKTHYPIISIILFIITVVINSIQYANNEDYLQEKIRKFKGGEPHISNILLYIYNSLLSINGFVDYTPAYIFVFILTFFAVSLIELNIGHASLLFLLFIVILKNSSWMEISGNICFNGSRDFNLYDNKYLLVISYGFILYLIQNNIKNIFYRMIVIFIMVCTWIILIVINRYNNDKYAKNFVGSIQDEQRTCFSILDHSYIFLFGICCGGFIGN